MARVLASHTYTMRSALPAVTRLPSGDQSQRRSVRSKLCWCPVNTFMHLRGCGGGGRGAGGWVGRQVGA